MDSVFQKITYYDLYGYTLPGCLFILLVFSYKIYMLPPDIINTYKDIHLYIFLIFIFSGMIMGIIITEISDIIFGRLFQNSYRSYLTERNIGISYSKITTALQKSGIINSSAAISAPSHIQPYLWYIYSEIQADNNYARIHNYASSELLYKNLSVVFIIGSLIAAAIWPLEAHIKIFLILAGGFFGCLMGYRGRQFKEKKDVYSIFWFVKKHS